jgi:integrase
MKATFTRTYLRSIKATGKAFWITDAGFRNLRLYVGASGIKIWYVGYQGTDGRNKSHKLGSADAFTVAEARNMAGVFLTALERGEQPEKRNKKKLQLGEFIETYYAPWVEANRKAGKETMAILRSQFKFLFEQFIEELKALELENWRTKRQESGTKASTLNRQVTALKAALNWGVEQDIIKSNPLNRLKHLQERDSNKKTRYLSDEERTRLLAALDEREARLRTGRESHNQFLAEREKELLPPLDGSFADYLKPMVLLAMNIGVRRGNLFSLKWGDVDFDTGTIYLPADTTKPGKDLHVYMNQTIIDTLTTWRQQSTDTSPEALVFPSNKKKGALMVSIKRSWAAVLKAAQIENFRFHDLRHDFASQLVMRGVDLNTVRDLLGHTDLKMTLRYAHLAPENKLKAVKLLDIEKQVENDVS